MAGPLLVPWHHPAYPCVHAHSDATVIQTHALCRLAATEKELVHESFVCDTRDHEDHTFCGVMFNVTCDTSLPAEYIEIQSLSVRGDLGPMTVWMTPDTFQNKHESEDKWTQLYSGAHAPSSQTYTALILPEPIRLKPGEQCGIYVHSALPGDEGLVYDNQRNQVRACLCIASVLHSLSRAVPLYPSACTSPTGGLKMGCTVSKPIRALVDLRKAARALVGLP